jgi:hypothetical protein
VTFVDGGGPVGFHCRAAPRQMPGPDGATLTVSDGDVVLGVVALEAGRAVLTTSSLTVGRHTITAAFSGTATAAPSSVTIVQQVDEPAALPPSPLTLRPRMLLAHTAANERAIPGDIAQRVASSGYLKSRSYSAFRARSHEQAPPASLSTVSRGHKRPWANRTSRGARSVAERARRRRGGVDAHGCAFADGVDA